MKKSLAYISALMLTLFLPFMAFAQATTPVVVADPNSDFFTQLTTFIAQWGGLSSMAKVAGGCLLLIALLKTSFLSNVWQKVPALIQTLTAPILGILAGLIAQGGTMTWATASAYALSGAGAVFLHEILDGVKTIPGLGAIYVTIITLAEGLLGGASVPPASSSPTK